MPATSLPTELAAPAAGRKRVAIATVGLAIAGLLFWRITWQVTFDTYSVADAYVYVKGAEDVHGPIDVLVARGDGQAYVALARDPTLARPEVFDRPEQAAFRAARPLWGWLGWVASLGNPRWTVGAFVALSLLGAAFLVWSLAGRIGWYALGAVVLPGTISALSQLTVEPFGMGLTWLGLTNGWGWLVPAALTRETYLIVPAVLLLRTRRARYAVPIAVWGAWQAVAVWRVGAGPLGVNDDRAGLALPQDGILDAVGSWSPATTFVFGLLAVSAALAWRRFRPFIAAYALVALFLGWLNWRYWQHFSRQLLPVFVFALVAAALAAHHERDEHVPLGTDR